MHRAGFRGQRRRELWAISSEDSSLCSQKLLNASAVSGQKPPLTNGGNGERAPLTNGGNGESPPLAPAVNGDGPKSVGAPDVRDSSGRFVKGNPGGPGNPHIRRVARLRTILFDSISDDDFRLIVARLAAVKGFRRAPLDPGSARSNDRQTPVVRKNGR